MADDPQCSQERQRREYVWRDGGFSIALNTNSPSASTTAWKTATRPGEQHRQHLSPRSDGREQRTALPTRHGRDVRFGLAGLPHGGRPVPGGTRPERALQTARSSQQQFDTTSATNSEVEQLNLLNAAQAQQMSEMQSQAAMQVCLASQMTVANMQQRNAAAQDLNTAARSDSNERPTTPARPTKATPGRPTCPNSEIQC